MNNIGGTLHMGATSLLILMKRNGFVRSVIGISVRSFQGMYTKLHLD